MNATKVFTKLLFLPGSSIWLEIPEDTGDRENEKVSNTEKSKALNKTAIIEVNHPDIGKSLRNSPISRTNRFCLFPIFNFKTEVCR